MAYEFLGSLVGWEMCMRDGYFLGRLVSVVVVFLFFVVSGGSMSWLSSSPFVKSGWSCGGRACVSGSSVSLVASGAHSPGAVVVARLGGRGLSVGL